MFIMSFGCLHFFEGVLFAVRIFTRLSAEYFFAIFYGNLLTFICRTPYCK